MNPTKHIVYDATETTDHPRCKFFLVIKRHACFFRSLQRAGGHLKSPSKNKENNKEKKIITSLSNYNY